MPKAFISSWVKKCVKELSRNKIKIKEKNLVVVFATTKEIQILNKNYRGKNKPTDILSFAPVEKDFLGELVICPEVIRKQAKEHFLTFNEELGYMLLHGVLHLLGFDHEKSKKEEKIMFSIQDKIFEDLV